LYNGFVSGAYVRTQESDDNQETLSIFLSGRVHPRRELNSLDWMH